MKVVSSQTIRGFAGCGVLALVLGLMVSFTGTLSAQTSSLDTVFIPNVSGGYGVVYATAVQPDGKIIIGGSFSSVNVEVDGDVVVTPRANIARLNAADGSVDATFNPNADNTVYSVAVQADGKILLGGDFTTLQPNGAATATARSRIARVNADGSLDAGFDPKADSYVLSLTVQADGKILLGGGFTTLQPNGAASPTARNRIARLNVNGSVDTSFNPGTGVEAEVLPVCNCIAVDGDGKILIGGYFTGVNGQSRNNVARLSANGSVDPAFNPGADGIVYSVAVEASGNILLGGRINDTRGLAARIDANGNVDAAFNPNPDYDVTGVAVQANGKILLNGSFYNVGGAIRNGLARLDTNGSLDPSITLGSYPATDLGPYGVAVQADGKIVLGGAFSSVMGTARAGLARLNNDPATQSLNILNSGQVQWLRSGSGPEVSPVTFELSTNGGTIWSVLGNGTRITGGWQLSGLTLPSSGSIRARGRTSGGIYSGSSGLVEKVQTFSLPPPPVASTLAAGSVTGTGAILNGTVNANGTSSTVTFEYGTTVAYGNTVAGTPSPVAGSSPVAVSAMLTGLATGTTYHYRVRGVNNGGTGNGGDLTFTTLTAIESWRQTYFGGPANGGLGADSATPDHDGIPNLLKYTLVIVPGTSGASALPSGQRRTYAEGDRLAVIFNRDPARNDITIYVEAADSPGGPWTQVLASSVNGAAMTGPGVVGETDAGGGRKTVEVRDTVNLSGAPGRFLHIRTVR